MNLHQERICFILFCNMVASLALFGCKSSPLTVTEVISGNTIVLSNGTKVQYAGLELQRKDHPSFTACRQANAYLVLNKTVHLVEEPLLSFEDVVVAYVYTPLIIKEETKYLFVNGELVRFGYAKVMPVEDKCQKQELWQSLLNFQEQEAKPQKLNLWSEESIEKRE